MLPFIFNVSWAIPMSLTTEISFLSKELKDEEGCQKWIFVKMAGLASDFRLSFNMWLLLLLQSTSLPWMWTSPLNPETLQHLPVSENTPGKYLEELMHPKMIKPSAHILLCNNIHTSHCCLQITKKLTYVNSTWKLIHKHILYTHFGVRKKTICESVHGHCLPRVPIFKIVNQACIELKIHHNPISYI